MKCTINSEHPYEQDHHISYDPEIKIPICVFCHQEEHPDHGVGSRKGVKYNITAKVYNPKPKGIIISNGHMIGCSRKIIRIGNSLGMTFPLEYVENNKPVRGECLTIIYGDFILICSLDYTESEIEDTKEIMEAYQDPELKKVILRKIRRLNRVWS